MQKFKSKVLSVSLALLLFIPTTSIPILAAETESTAQSSSVYNIQTKYTDEYLSYLKAKAEGTWDNKFGYVPLPFELIPSKFIYSKRDVLPTVYDPRSTDPNLDMTTPVRDQSQRGTCYIFGLLATLEHCLIKQGLGKHDLSEEQLALKYIAKPDENGVLQGLQTFNTEGGDSWLLSSHIISKESPVSEQSWTYDWCKNTVSDIAHMDKDDPVRTDNIRDRLVSEFDLSTGKEPILFDVKNILVIDHNDRNAIKQAILNYGAATYNYFSDNKYLNPTDQKSYFDNGSTEANHAVCVVGWDDNYDRNNFQDSESGLPTANGAWLIKNSWGTEQKITYLDPTTAKTETLTIPTGDQGYFWMSYESKTYMDFVTFEGLSVHNPKGKIYQHTTSPAEWIPFSGFKQDISASVFDFDETNRILSSVIVENCQPGVKYNISYAPVKNGNIDMDSAFNLISNYQLDKTGYITIDLPTPVCLDPGKYAIIIKRDISHLNEENFYLPLIITNKSKWVIEDCNPGEHYQIVDNVDSFTFNDLFEDNIKLSTKVVTQPVECKAKVYTDYDINQMVQQQLADLPSTQYNQKWTDQTIDIYLTASNDLPRDLLQTLQYSIDDGQTWTNCWTDKADSIAIMRVKGKNSVIHWLPEPDMIDKLIENDGITNIKFKYTYKYTNPDTNIATDIDVPFGELSIKIDSVVPVLQINDKTNQLAFSNLAENASEVKFLYQNGPVLTLNGEWQTATSLPKLEDTYYVKAVNESGISSNVETYSVSSMEAAATISQGGMIGLITATAVTGAVAIVGSIAAFSQWYLNRGAPGEPGNVAL